jgi:hypothetical protein
MASSTVRIVLKSLNGDMLEIEVDPYDSNIYTMLRQIVKNEMFPDTKYPSDIQFIRMDDDNDVLGDGEVVMVMIDYMSGLFSIILSENNENNEIEERIKPLSRNEKRKIIDKLLRTLNKNIPSSKQTDRQSDLTFFLEHEKYDYGNYPRFFHLHEIVQYILDDITSVDMITRFQNGIDRTMTKATRIARGDPLKFTREEITKDIATLVLQRVVSRLVNKNDRRNYFKSNLLNFFRFLITDVDADLYGPIVGDVNWIPSYLNVDTNIVYNFAEIINYLVNTADPKQHSQETIDTLHAIRDMINASSFSFGCKKKSRAKKTRFT